jgi:hypothetical protein
MMSGDAKAKELLETLLRDIYLRQTQNTQAMRDSYLLAADDQYLGRITGNRYDTNSLLNEYGPYGSKYSQTSIFNPYSPYGSPYGQFSVNNPYSSTPPQLFIHGNLLGRVTKNPYIPQRIATEAFIYTLENDVDSLLSGRVIESETQARILRHESFIVADDGTYLGSLDPNSFDTDSIFNQFGPYGSQFSQTSIFNQFCPYGGQFSHLSPFNQFTQTPPKVYVNGQFSGYLTVNQLLNPRVDPKRIREWAHANLHVNL